MSSNWPILKLKDLSLKITKGSTPTAKDGGFSQSGINFIKAESVTLDGRINPESFQFISNSVHQKYARSQLETDDILFSMAGMALGKVGIVREEYLPANTNQALALIRLNKELALPTYIYYFLRQKKVVHFVNNAISQSAQPNINLEQIGNLEVSLPPFSIQVDIVNILGCLDKKIDASNEINQTLEEMAQAIFKSWFVDFDPVKAKAQVIAQGGSEQDANLAAMQIISGKTRDQLAALEHTHPEQYTQLHTTASLFPSAFVDSELGEIPKGWEITKISSILTLNYGRALKSTDRIEGDVPVYGSGGVNGYHNQPLVTEESIVVGRKGSIGNLFWVDKPFFSIDTTFYVASKIAPLSFCYYTLVGLNLSKMNTDAAVPGLNRDNVYRCEVCFPTTEILQHFDSTQSSLRKLIAANRQETSYLEDARNLLLPKLLSGELEV